MHEEIIITNKKDPYGGFLSFKGITWEKFNDLHATVTTRYASCGKGFHITAYKSQVINTHNPANVVGRIYFTVDECTRTAKQGAQEGNFNDIVSSGDYPAIIDAALAFYLKIFGLVVVKPYVSDNDFPALVSTNARSPAAAAAATSSTAASVGHAALPAMSAPGILPNPLVSPSGAAVGNSEFLARLSRSLDYSKGYALFAPKA